MNRALVFLRKFLPHILIVGVAFYFSLNGLAPSTKELSSLTAGAATLMRSFVSWLPSHLFSSMPTVPRKNEDARTKKQQEIEQSLLKQGRRLISEECSPNTQHCYLIVDNAVKEDDEIQWLDSWLESLGTRVMTSMQATVSRQMCTKEWAVYCVQTITFTAQAKRKPELTWSNFNTKTWPINKLVITSRYIRMHIAVSFFHQSLSFEPKRPQKVLSIGLGGGVIPNFLSVLDWLQIETTVVEIDPFVAQVAEKFFGLTDERTNIVIDDGVQFLKKSKQNKQKFDAIMLDACYDERRDVLCPVDSFLTAGALEDLSAILHEQGVVTVNIICTRDAFANEETILKLFKEHFNTCYLLKYVPERRMLICTHRENWSWEEKKELFKKNLLQVDDTFDFRLSKFFT